MHEQCKPLLGLTRKDAFAKLTQNIFRFIGLAEKAGSGMDKIQQGWWEGQLATPRINEQNTPMRVTCTLPYLAMVPKKHMLEAVKRIGRERFDALKVKEKVIMLLVHENEEMTLKDIKSSYSIDRAYLTDALNGLVEKGYLQIVKTPGTESYYKLQTPGAPCKVGNGTVRTAADGTVRTAADGTVRTANHNNPHKINKEHPKETPGTPCKVGNETVRTAADGTMRTANYNNLHKINKEHPKETPGTPCKVDDGTVRTADHNNPHKINKEHPKETSGTPCKVGGGAQPNAEEENWRTREEIEEAIRKICDKRWVRKKEIALALRRYPRSLQQRYLRPMVESGRLQMLYPDKQNHPRQAYRARKNRA